MTFFNILNVHAESTTFYGGDFIDGIYMSKYEYSTNTIYYQKAKMMKNEFNEPVYCLDPFNLFDENATYTRNDNVNNMDYYTKETLKKIAHFGYGYKNHTEPKWYAATQMLIWRKANSNIGRYYFTDSLNGNEITILENEMNEIQSLVNYYNVDLIGNNTYTMLENSSLSIGNNSVIMEFTSNSENVVIRNNRISVINLKEGYYEFPLTRKLNINNRFGFMYSAPGAQSLIERGDLEDTNLLLNVQVYKSRINITKLDNDTNDIKPQGEASLDGAIYGLYNSRNDELIEEITIENNHAQIEGLLSGNYYIKEISPGEGYELDNEKYEFNISTKNYEVNLELKNQVIKKNIIINKKYGETNNIQPEKDIVFDIYNSKDELISTIVTNENGDAEITLPYGKYKIVQANSTPGYKKVDPISIEINNNEQETIELIDYKIEVPNTHSEKSITPLIISILLLLLF